MNLGDQLDELRYNILRDRSDLIAGDTDSFWSDETLLRYIKDAERRFARRVLCLRDGVTPQVTQIKLKNGVQTYPLDKSVFGVISANYTPVNGQRYDLQRSGHALIVQSSPNEAVVFDPVNPYATQLPPGDPLAYFTDETLVFAQQSRVTLSVYPPPATTQDGTILYLRVVRAPLKKYDLNSLGLESEIPEDYQLDVLRWAAYRAQSTWDGDAGAPVPASQHQAAFEDAVKKAVQELKRRMFAQMQFQFGANGYSWPR